MIMNLRPACLTTEKSVFNFFKKKNSYPYKILLHNITTVPYIGLVFYNFQSAFMYIILFRLMSTQGLKTQALKVFGAEERGQNQIIILIKTVYNSNKKLV